MAFARISSMDQKVDAAPARRFRDRLNSTGPSPADRMRPFHPEMVAKVD
jgi:hypothetical protein